MKYLLFADVTTFQPVVLVWVRILYVDLVGRCGSAFLVILSNAHQEIISYCPPVSDTYGIKIFI